MALETEIEVQDTGKEGDPYRYIAGIKTEEYGTFYGYGKTKQEAIKDGESEMNFWISKNEQG